MELLSGIIFISLVTCALSSGWLYSELLSELRNWWLRYYKGKKLQYLAICQLCCSFWIALPVSVVIVYDAKWYSYVFYSLAAAVVSWALGAWVQNQLWQKAYIERQYKLSNGRDIKGL